jgi:hypothetical protein
MKKGSKSHNPKKHVTFVVEDFSILTKADRGILTFLGCLSFLTLYITPWIIPPDGSLYLTSAKSIYTTDMFAYYHWMREPLYPTFLKILLFDNNLFFVMFVQSILIGVSIFLVYKSFGFFLRFDVWQKYLASFLSFIFIRGFATEILMQALLLFIVALATYVCSRIVFYEKMGRKCSKSVFLAGGVVAILAFALQVLVGISILLVFIFILIRTKSSSPKQRFATITSTILICVIGLGLWQNIKNNAIENGDLIFGSNSLTKFQFFESADPIKRQEQRIQAFTGTLGIAPEKDAFISRPVGVALREWAMPFFNNEVWNQNGQCGQYDRSHSNRILTYIAPLTKVKYCHSPGQVTMSNFLSAIGMIIYPLFSLLIITFIVLLIFSFDLRLIALFGISTLMLFQYSAVGQGHSRFGAPLFMVSPFLLMFILSKRKLLFENLWVKN